MTKYEVQNNNTTNHLPITYMANFIDRHLPVQSSIFSINK